MITVQGREFEIGEPDALQLIAILHVVGRVGTRAEGAAVMLGQGLLSQIIPNQKEDMPQVNLAGSLFPFLAALTQDDLADFMAALLQFDDPVQGKKWVKQHPPTLQEVVTALRENLEHAEGIVEAIQNFTQAFTSLSLLQRVMAGQAEEIVSGADG